MSAIDDWISQRTLKAGDLKKDADVILPGETLRFVKKLLAVQELANPHAKNNPITVEDLAKDINHRLMKFKEDGGSENDIDLLMKLIISIGAGALMGNSGEKVTINHLLVNISICEEVIKDKT